MMKSTSSLKPILFFIGIYLLFLFASSILIFILQWQQLNTLLTQKIIAIKKDVHVKNNNWNLAQYNSDPHLLGNYPLYFFSTDGFVLDRRAPINGFLDTSNFNRLLRYIQPQTVTTITNQTRRMVSQPILWEGKPIAVISVSYFNPRPNSLSDIDKLLLKNLNYISSKVVVKNGIADVHTIDARYIPYNIAFVIVDRFNTILKKTTNVNSINRIPNVIDPSYIKPYLQSTRNMIVQDHVTKEFFLMKSDQIFNKNHEAIGIIIIGQSLSSTLSLIFQYIIWAGIGSIFFIGVSFIILLHMKNSGTYDNTSTHTHVIFDEQKGMLFIGNQHIKIPYATNQFYLLQAVFNRPMKRWETDELLKRFGEEQTKDNWRKIYDTMVKINKKVSRVTTMKLIINQNKTYRLNPDVSSL